MVVVKAHEFFVRDRTLELYNCTKLCSEISQVAFKIAPAIVEVEGNLQTVARYDDVVDVFHRLQTANEQNRLTAVILADRTCQGQVNIVRQHRHIGLPAHGAIISLHDVRSDRDMVSIVDDEALDKARD